MVQAKKQRKTICFSRKAQRNKPEALFYISSVRFCMRCFCMTSTSCFLCILVRDFLWKNCALSPLREITLYNYTIIALQEILHL
jgi:hypothetical protein